MQLPRRPAICTHRQLPHSHSRGPSARSLLMRGRVLKSRFLSHASMALPGLAMIPHGSAASLLSPCYPPHSHSRGPSARSLLMRGRVLKSRFHSHASMSLRLKLAMIPHGFAASLLSPCSPPHSHSRGPSPRSLLMRGRVLKSRFLSHASMSLRLKLAMIPHGFAASLLSPCYPPHSHSRGPSARSLLMRGRVLKSRFLSHASMSWKQTFDTGIIS
ncbi:hypothetical protein GCWU000341_00633 [Oribacterium sp. oral taxon 078 str. F0262]|nr:hypothetical protein GCWU000341_00633 [Oribacterium sp. oral taxon 078 str. F0262]